MIGLVQGIYYGQQERVDELNERIQRRQFPDKPLAPNFSSRPVLSKYSRFPILDRRAPFEEPIRPVDKFHVSTHFNPGSYAPPTTYLQSVDTESGLRNQTVAYHRRAPQSVYVPSSTSDLYHVQIPFSSTQPIHGQQSHPSLFQQPIIESTTREAFVRNNVAIGRDLFFNNTRTQLRSLV
jgi:hypothetical protein